MTKRLFYILEFYGLGAGGNVLEKIGLEARTAFARFYHSLFGANAHIRAFYTHGAFAVIAYFFDLRQFFFCQPFSPLFDVLALYQTASHFVNSPSAVIAQVSATFTAKYGPSDNFSPEATDTCRCTHAPCHPMSAHAATYLAPAGSARHSPKAPENSSAPRSARRAYTLFAHRGVTKSATTVKNTTHAQIFVTVCAARFTAPASPAPP